IAPKPASAIEVASRSKHYCIRRVDCLEDPIVVEGDHGVRLAQGLCPSDVWGPLLRGDVRALDKAATLGGNETSGGRGQPFDWNPPRILIHAAKGERQPLRVRAVWVARCRVEVVQKLFRVLPELLAGLVVRRVPRLLWPVSPVVIEAPRQLGEFVVQL